MKVLTIKLAGKTYTTGKITAFMSKEAIKINKDALALAKRGSEFKEQDIDVDAAESLLADLEEINNRKVWLICTVYGDKFSPDDIEKELSTEEIDQEITKIIYGISGVASKN